MFIALPLISNQLSQITCLSGLPYLSVLVCHFLPLECTILNPQAMGMFSTRHSSNTGGNQWVGRISGKRRTTTGGTLWSSKMSRQHLLEHLNFSPYTTVNPFISWQQPKSWWWLRYSESSSASLRSIIGTWLRGKGPCGRQLSKA